MRQKKYILSEQELPTQWYNIQADMPNKPLPPLNPQTHQPMSADDLSHVFNKECSKQELDTEHAWIDIPEDVLEKYTFYRSTPLVRAYALEEALGTPAHIYFKNESTNPLGSHKINSAIPQCYVSDRAFDTIGWDGFGAPVKPVGLIASMFRPSDDATILPFLIPSNFMAVSSMNKAAEILKHVAEKDAAKKDAALKIAKDCSSLADEVQAALQKYAIYNHPKYGKIYAYEVDGFGNQLLMDDSNVPSLLGMGYMGDVPMNDPIYQNTRRFVWSEDNPCFFRGKAGEGIGGPHIGYDMPWPMSIMMKCFTAQSDDEIRFCMKMLLNTDAGMGFIHESFHKDDASKFTRPWFAWQNTLFGELVIKLINDGKADLLNNL